MQFDRTRIAVRPRGFLEMLDLSLLVLREYAGPLSVAMLMGVAPLMAVNWLLLGWMVDTGDVESATPWRFLYHLSLQIYLQAPLAGVFATAYLGQAVFLDAPRLADEARNVLRMLPRLAWCHLVMRGVGAGWVLALLINRQGPFNEGVEVFFLWLLVGWIGLVRAIRPFINEIILLERCPLTSRSVHVVTVGRRGWELRAADGGRWFSRWVGLSLVGVLLSLSAYGTMYFVVSVVLEDWSRAGMLVPYLLPLTMWGVAGVFTVFRFLAYLDARIRQEGWEVELRLRAEVTRLAE